MSSAQKFQVYSERFLRSFRRRRAAPLSSFSYLGLLRTKALLYISRIRSGGSRR